MNCRWCGVERDAPGPHVCDPERVRDLALEEAACIADAHWPEAGHAHPGEGTISCQMTISIDIRRKKSTYGKRSE